MTVPAPRDELEAVIRRQLANFKSRPHTVNECTDAILKAADEYASAAGDIASQVTALRAAEVKEQAVATDGENARLLADLAGACSHRDLLAAALARIEARADGYDPGTNEYDVHEIAAKALGTRQQ